MKRGKIGHCLKPDLLAYIHLSPSLFPSLFGCSSVNIVWFLTHGQCKRHRSEVRFQNLARCESKSALRNYPKFIKIRDIPPNLFTMITFACHYLKSRTLSYLSCVWSVLFEVALIVIQWIQWIQWLRLVLLTLVR